MKVTKSTILNKVLKDIPKSSKVFESFNMRCASCGGQNRETVEWAAITHGVDPDKLVQGLNKAGHKKKQ